jgi:hypothetical protein
MRKNKNDNKIRAIYKKRRNQFQRQEIKGKNDKVTKMNK